MGVIYLAENKNDGTVYIGKSIQSLQKRIYNHCADVRRGSTMHFHSAIRKYGIDVFSWRVLEVVPDQFIGYIEMAWISLYRTMGYRLYNQTNGGDGCSGARPSEATKLKIGLGNKGKVISPEARARVAEANKRRDWTEESNAKHALTSSGGKVYTFVSPKGEWHTNIVNFKGFCKEHGIQSRSMWRAIKEKRRLRRGPGTGWLGWLEEETT